MKTAIRGALLTFRRDPLLAGVEAGMYYESDGVVVIEAGSVVAAGPAATTLPALGADVAVTHYPDHLILPGFIDCHVHYPQTEMIAAYGEQLIDWLNHYTFVTEQAFADKSHAAEVAEVFLAEQLRHGVTSSAVFCTVHPDSVDALFEAAERRQMRLLAGKVCMDQYAPAELLDNAERAYAESKALIERWHRRGRAEYAITPRFAPTSSVAQLEALGALAAEYPDMAIQSHLAETPGEIAWVKSLHPDSPHYTAVYQRYGLLRPRAVYGHGVHLADEELQLLYDSGASLAHCPSSNAFLGSGSFDLRRARAVPRPVRVGLATDLGAGTSFSMLQTMRSAYEAAQTHGVALSAPQAFYLATRGSAEALGIADKVGSIEVGLEADLVVLNLRSTPLIDFRMRYVRDIEEALFVQMILGDDRAIAATYVAGQLQRAAGLAG